jgi:RND superfamily putative drug exporter
MIKRFSPTAVGGWSTRRPVLAIAAWLSFVVLALLALIATGTKQLQNGAVGESARGDAVLNSAGLGSPQLEYAYLHSASTTVGDPAFRAAIDRVDAGMRRVLGAPVQVSISRDRHAALVAGQVNAPFSTAELQHVVRAASRADRRITATMTDLGNGSSKDLARAEKLSVPVTLAVLLIVFGTLVAAAVPVLLAVTAVAAAFGVLGPISHLFPVDDSVKTVVLLIGMAVGVDYALFYVVRAREERRRGLPSHEALDRTARTSGRSVVIAGTSVVIAMAAQFAVGSEVFNGIASGTIVVVACAVIGSVTVLPAVLEILGPRIDRGRIPFLPRWRIDCDGGFWGAIVDGVLRRPVLAGTLSCGLLVALAVPALGMQVSKPSNDTLSAAGQSSLVRQITSEFPGASSPAIVTATWAGGQPRGLRAAVGRLESLASSSGIAHRPFSVMINGGGRALAIALPLTGQGDNPASRRAVRDLRTRLIPETLGRVPGVRTAVTGATAEDVDFTNQMKAGIPYVVGLVLALAFVVLLVAFRSIVVPLKAIALNLLSVGASYGVLVLVFQHHWAEGLLGFHSDGAVISWLPLFLFVVLFGLSMDYHVFILSRVREGVDAGMTTQEALRHGITRTAGVVSGAALVMVAVFSLFGTSSSLDLKQAGIGLAVAVLLDATVIRGVLLPATMKLLGDRNWYLPSFLHWLPKVGLETPSPPADAHPALAFVAD